MKPLIYFLILLCLCAATPAQQSSIKFSTEEDFKTDIALSPCKDKDRFDAVKKLFLSKGADESDIVTDKFKSVENLSVTIKGKTDETVIVGAHYDKTDDGCGAIDNWSGVVILANLYQTMRDLTTQKTYVFTAFGKEEKGLIGSGAMADNIPKEKRAGYCAMVNFDSFGLSYPQALRNISDTPLIKLAEEVSKEMKIPFAQAGIDFASSDSESFRQKKIPAISLHGLNSRWQEFLHSSNDKVQNVNITSVYVGYRHGLIFLSKIEERPCDAFRK